MNPDADTPTPAFEAVPGLIFKGWGEEAEVVYSTRTASTLLVSAEAADVLRLAAETPVEAAQMAHGLLADRHGIDATEGQAPQLQQQLTTLLESLVQAGLLTRVPCPQR